MVEAIRPVLSRHFKPALLARMTIIPFYLLDPEFMREIVTLRLEKLAARLHESNKMQLVYSAEVVERIAARCTEVETGARNIDHIMRGTILPQLSGEILTHMGGNAMPSTVRLGVTTDGNFSISFGFGKGSQRSKGKAQVQPVGSGKRVLAMETADRKEKSRIKTGKK